MSELLGKILCVDDESSVRGVIDTYLTGLGYEVHTEADPDQAIEYLNSLPWEPDEDAPVDIVLTDGNRNYQLLDAVHAAYPWIPVIVVSGDWECPEHASDMLKKPFDIKDLGKIVDKFMHERPKSVRILRSEVDPNYQKA